MKVLFVSPEVGPIVRAGGLGDVVGSLPYALKKLGIDVRIICPMHRECKDINTIPISNKIKINFESKSFLFRLRETTLGDSKIPVYLLQNNHLFDRAGIYSDENGNYFDNPIRSFALCRSALLIEKFTKWSPDIFHCHDWMTAALPAYLNEEKIKRKLHAKSVLTIHNLEHQGSFSAENFSNSELPNKFFGWDGFNHHGELNLLKGGIQHANKITTVSPTYAKEIKTEEFGEGLDKCLEYRGADLIGILNGIDLKSWNPQTDKALEKKISKDSPESGKIENKKALLKQFSIKFQSTTPLFGVVSRLFHQKGLDILAQCLPSMLSKEDFQFILLGSGDAYLESSFLKLKESFPDRIGVRIGFDDTLARRIFAGSDFFIMPSRFEPCGLAQQYALRYGSIPVARKTGGLADTILDLKSDEKKGNGLLFEKISTDSLSDVINNAISLFHNTPKLKLTRNNAMNSPLSWDSSAKEYAKVYQWALES